MSRPPVVLAGPFFPISDLEGINGDFFMQVGTNNTFIIFGPKANNTWVGAPQCTLANQLAPSISFLQYLGDQGNAQVVALPNNFTGVNGQLCFLLDAVGACCAVAVNQNGIWGLLFSQFTSPLTVLSAGGKPVYQAPTGTPVQGQGGGGGG